MLFTFKSFESDYNMFGEKIYKPEHRWEEKLEELSSVEFRKIGLEKKELRKILNYLYDKDVIR